LAYPLFGFVPQVDPPTPCPYDGFVPTAPVIRVVEFVDRAEHGAEAFAKARIHVGFIVEEGLREVAGVTSELARKASAGGNGRALLYKRSREETE
jgi:hypothetical protein